MVVQYPQNDEQRQKTSKCQDPNEGNTTTRITHVEAIKTGGKARVYDLQTKEDTFAHQDGL